MTDSAPIFNPLKEAVRQAREHLGMDKPTDSAPSVEDYTAEMAAADFHATYEFLAPQFGYTTRKDTREFKADSPNGKLMIAVCDVVLSRYRSAERERVLEVAKQAIHNAVHRKSGFVHATRGLREIIDILGGRK